MKNEILKAIDKGLMNVLSADIQDHDIDFDDDAIDSGYLHKITLDELQDIFEETPDCLFSSKYDTKDAVSLILDDDTEISLFEYESSMNPLFVKISNGALKRTHNEILVYVPDSHFVTTSQWQDRNVQVRPDECVVSYKKYQDACGDAAVADLGGYMNCKVISDIVKSNPEKGAVPAIEYCMEKAIGRHRGYLPSMGQLRVLADCSDIVNHVLKQVGSKNMLYMNFGKWLSSTEFSYSGIWHLKNGETTGTYNSKMHEDFYVLPVFTF